MSDTAADTAAEREAPIADVLIVGGGPAGLMAGITAAAAGADVVILERNEEAGGAARWATTLLLAGTTLQQEAGIVDSPEMLLADWEALTCGADPADPWVQLLAHQGADLYDWFEARGVAFRLPGSPDGVPRRHTLDGGGTLLVEALVSEVDPAALWLGWDVLDLDLSGPLPAVEAVGPDGDTHRLAAGAVVLATGGFFRDAELVARALPALDHAAMWQSTGTWADGRGHRMLEAAGAQWRRPEAAALVAHGVPHPDPQRPGHELLLSKLLHATWVDVDGQRFLNEQHGLSNEAGATVAAQPGHIAWAIFDRDSAPALHESLFEVMAAPFEVVTDVSLDDLAAAGYAAEADSLDALAEQIGVSAAGLNTTVEAMHAAADAGEPDPWQGQVWAGPRTPPYIALRVVPAFAKAFGGIAVGSDGAVLLGDDTPLEGVYAAGELTGMAGGELLGDCAIPGSLSAVLLSGAVAGESAAEAVTAAARRSSGSRSSRQNQARGR